MKIKSTHIPSVILTISLATAGCANMTPAQNSATVGVAAAGVTELALSLAGVKQGVALPVAAGVGAIFAGATYIIAKNQATAHQKQIAKERASAYYANLNSQQKSQLPRHLAVQTTKTAKTKGDPVMLYDTKTGQVEDYVWDFKAAPATGQKTKIDSVDATYIALGQ